jgi:hypothetical protein
VNDYKFSLASAGAVAATVGISFDSLSTAIAVMGNAGIKGSDAGTSLKTMLLNLQPTTKDARIAFRQLGILTADGANAFFDATGKAKSFAEIAEILKTSMAGMTKQQQLATLEVMFGSDAIRAGAVLLESGAEGFNHVAEAMSKVTAQSVANERLNNLWGSVEKLKGSLETAAIILGGQFTPALKRMADAATDAANTMITAFEMLPDVWGDVVAAFTGGQMDDALDTLLTSVLGFSGETAQMFEDVIRAAGEMWTGLQPILTGIAAAIQDNIAPIAAFVAGFLGAIGTVGLFTAAIAAVTAVLTLLLSPIGLVAIAVGLLAAAWTTNFMGIQEATAAAWAYLLPIFTQIVDWLGPKISAVLTWLTTTGWPMMLAAATAVGNWITTVAIPALTQLVDWLGPKLSAVVTWIYETGWPSLVTAGETVVTVVTAILKWFTDLFTALEQRTVFTELGVIWTTLVSIGEKVWAIIQKIIDVFTPFKALGDQFNTGTGALMVGMFAKLAETMGLTVGPIELISKGLSGLFAIISLQLSMVEKFIGYLDKIAAFKMPSFNLSGGSSPSGGIGTMSFGGGGGGGSNEQKLGRAAQIAAEMGFTETQIRAMQGTLLAEGGLQGAPGDSGTSTGPFQLHSPGQFENFQRWLQQQGIQGDARALSNDIELSTRFALGNYYGAALRAGPQGDASALATYAQQYGQVSINPWKAGQLAPAQVIGGSNPNLPGRMDRIPLGGGGMGSDPSQWPGFMSQVNEQLPDYLMSLDTIQQAGTLAFNGTTQAAVAAGTELVNAWSTTGTAVVAQTNLMQTGALTSVTNLGTGFLTTVQTTAGTAIATVTDMSGQITTQYATLANGVTLNAGTMQTGVLTATTAMHDGTILSVQDMAGNAIVTVTDMHGQVTNQYTTMAAESGAVLSEFAALNLEQFGAVAESALQPIGPIEDLGSALADIPQADMSDTVKQFGEAAAAAKKAQAAIKALADATEDLPGSFGGSKGGKSSGLSKKAAGGWASGLTLVGEEGPELLSLNRPHYVTPNSALSGSGGPVTVVNVSVGGSLVAQSELEDTIARAVATSLRGGSLAWSN